MVRMDTQDKQPWRLAIGELFSPGRTSWPEDSFELRYFDGSYLLQVCEAHPSNRSVEAFRQGTMHIGLHFERGVIFFLFRIEGSWDWSDQAFTIHRVHPANRKLDPAPGRYFSPLTVALVNSATGVVEAMRMVTMSPRFGRAFQTYMARQLEAPYSAETHEATIRELYAKYPHSKHIAAAALHRERAGSNVV